MKKSEYKELILQPLYFMCGRFYSLGIPGQKCRFLVNFE